MEIMQSIHLTPSSRTTELFLLGVLTALMMAEWWSHPVMMTACGK
jgi:hypothetical protein